MHTVYLIGGAPGAGKSTVAKELSARLNLPWISTDQIRRVLNVDEAKSQDKVELTQEGIVRLLHGLHPWDDGILEGVELMPEFIKKDLESILNIKPVFLIQTDEQIANVTRERAKLPWIHTKTPEQQFEKIKQVSELNAAMNSQATALGYSVVSSHTENTFNEVLKVFGVQ